MNKEKIISGVMVTKKELEQLGFDENSFSYYVNAIVTSKRKTTIFHKCKAIASDEGETVYLSEGKNSMLLFYASKNPNIKIIKLLTN